MTLSRQTCRWNWPSGDGQNDDDDGTCHHLLAPRPGECCPRCKTCQWINNHNNVTIIHEGRSPVSPDPQKEPCTQCQCSSSSSNDSSMICTRQTCPVLPCPANKALLQPGACCPVCQGVRKEIIPSSSSSNNNICQIGKKTFEFGAQFRPDPCTNCTCQNNSTTVCVRDNSRRHCPNVHPATITVSPSSSTSTSTESPVVDSFQRQQEATSSSTSSTSMKATIQMPTALPASRPLTCAYRGVTYQVKNTFELQFTFTHTHTQKREREDPTWRRFDDVVNPGIFLLLLLLVYFYMI